MTMTIGRLVLDDPEKMDEGTGEAVDHLGAMPVPATRSGRKVKLGLHTLDAAFVDTVAARQTIRRQLRSLVNNRGWTLTGIYVSSTTDPEWDGWYVPEPADLTIAENGGDAVGWYRLDLSAYRVGLNRTHRPATIVRVMDVTAATAPRDLLRTDYSTDFDGMTARPEVSIPYTASGIKVSGAKTLSRASRGPLRGGGYLTLIWDVSDGDAITYDRTAGSDTNGDVVAYDRRGTATLTSTGPNTAWEEVYGPDWPWSSSDAPVLDNGLVRISQDTAGFVWEAWTGSAYEEVARIGARLGSFSCIELLDAGLYDYTPDRATMWMEVAYTGREEIETARLYCTLQRGWNGPRIDMYRSASTGIEARLVVLSSEEPAHHVVAKQDTTAVSTVGSGTGTALTDNTTVGDATFTDENWIAMLRTGATRQIHAAVLQAGLGLKTARTSSWHGSSRNGFYLVGGASIASGNEDWIGALLTCDVSYDGQSNEAEDFTLSSGTSSTADGTASGGTATTSTRVGSAPHITYANWPDAAAAGTYRILARVRSSGGATVRVQAVTSTTTGDVITTTSTSYVWLDLGDIVADGTLTINAWINSGTLYIDRIEAVRVTSLFTSDMCGARDVGQSALADVRPTATLAAR